MNFKNFYTLCSSLFISSMLALPAVANNDHDTEHQQHNAHEEKHPEAECSEHLDSGMQEHHQHSDHQHLNSPIGMMGTHQHPAGSSMVSFRFMAMDMRGMLDGNQAVTEMEAMNEFHMLPRSMTMLMPMLGGMYAPSDWLTLMIMAPANWMHMEHVHHGDSMNMSASGLGDLSLTALAGNWNFDQHHIHLNIGLGLPTGAIDINDDQQILPYSMRLGSGTWDLLPGLTYTGQYESLSWGIQPQARLRMGHNALGYKLGNQIQTNLWGGWQILNWLQSSVRLNYQVWDNVDGADQRLAEAMHTQPGADPQRQAGQRLDLLAGLSFNGTETFMPGQRLGLEFGIPVFQSLAGPQLGTRWLALAGWEWQF